ncbi:peptide/nickel transport system permease protein [Rossellomorea marisflavi]
MKSYFHKYFGAHLSISFIFLLLILSLGNTVFNDGEVKQQVLLKSESGDLLAPPFAPSQEFLLGSDEKGYDLLGRVIEGAKWSIGITILIAILRTFFAFLFGIILSFQPKRLFYKIEALFDSFSILPLTMIAYVILLSVLTIESGSDPSPFAVRAGFEIFILVILVIPPLSLYIANETNIIKRKEFMNAATILGGTTIHNIFKHIVPHLSPLMIVVFIQQFIQTLIIFLHLGVLGLFFGGTIVYFGDTGAEIDSLSQEWSGLIGATFRYIYSYPWIPLVPMIFYALTILSAQKILKWVETFRATDS